ncbi:MAG: sulfite exporter TauE/SafE family protein [Halioglobus sp.]
MNELQMLSAFSLGLAGAGHCLGMCGGIAAAMNLGGNATTSTTLSYHAGRILSYTALGGALGYASSSVDIAAWTLFLRYLAGILLVFMGLYVGNWWRGMAVLERAGSKLWQPVQKMSARWLPIRSWRQALPLGLCWGLMPCGLIYSSLAWASTASSGLQSAALMFLFGLGTLPAMLATSLGAKKIQGFLQRRGLKVVIAVLLIASGVWTLYMTYSHGGHAHGAASIKQDHSTMDHPGH